MEKVQRRLICFVMTNIYDNPCGRIDFICLLSPDYLYDFCGPKYNLQQNSKLIPNCFVFDCDYISEAQRYNIIIYTVNMKSDANHVRYSL